MASAKEIKRKIRSINNTGKITKAMELISTVKMRKAQELALEKRNFVLEMMKIFLRVESYLAEFPLFSQENSNGKTLGVMITSNKGLCGGYNINVMKKVNHYMKETKADMEFICIGKKAAQFIARTGNTLIADFSEEFTDTLDPVFTKKISSMIQEEFNTSGYSKVVVFYNHYVNTIKQIPVGRLFLPISAEEIKEYLFSILQEADINVEEELENLGDIHAYEIEPTPEELVRSVVPMVLDMMFFDILSNAKASEHSSRMIAMKNAKDNAKKIASSLKMKYNKARQAMITKEVSEITSGVEAMKD